MSAVATASDSPRLRVRMLSAQGFALGLTMAWIMIPASALFLAAYGPEWLPVTYIGAAAAGAASSSVLARALRRLPLATVASRILAGLALMLLLAWIVVATWTANWVCFVLLVLVPIVVPVGFVFLVGQAGLLLDVRSLKSLYARVVAGFALGFVAGGLAGPVLLSVLGATENLLAAAAVAAAGFFVLVGRTRRRYPAELAVVEQSEIDDERPTLRSLIRNRFLLLLVTFQMLSAVESQWLDFLVFDRAAERYHDSAELARFVSRFSAIAYGADILFLLVCAGWLLRKFGLRYGLAANAVGVLSVVAALLVAGALQGSFATIVFVLVVAARVTDLTLSDGAARTSMSAAYQAVPSRLRSVTQAAVEGLAVPVAIGASGVVLLVVQAVGAIDGPALPVLTVVVLTIWTVVAVLAYQEYRVSLLANLRGRTLEQSDLTLEGEGSLLAIDRLVDSDDERDVRLGLDILARADHPELVPRLRRLLDDGRINVRTDARDRLVALDAVGAAAASVDERVIAAQMLGALDGGSVTAGQAVRQLLEDGDPAVVVAALHALRWPDDLDLLDPVTRLLGRRSTSAAAVSALRRAGEPALEVISEAIADDTRGRRVHELLVRVTRDIAGPSTRAVLHRHLDHSDREVGLAVMQAVAMLGAERGDAAGDTAGSALAAAEVEHATRVLSALLVFDDDPVAALQCAALRDEFDLSRRRVLAALSMRHGIAGLHRVTFHLAQRDARSHALALEWLDVTLTGTDRAVIPMLEPGLSERARLQGLRQWFPVPTRERTDVLLDLVGDPTGRWRPWIAACAIYTASATPDLDLAPFAAAAAHHGERRGTESAIVAETLIGVGARPGSVPGEVAPIR
ncbi:MAG: hypothetical protein JJE46_04560 [Acidimicrobiia bacterium]|nr:hypothetical protein [Acidimicrobiia bacterium]